MTALAVVRWNVWSYGSDTGTFAQVAINAWNGFGDGVEGGTHFRFHWSPILALLWPFVALTRSALSIQIVQVFLIAATAIPLAAIVRTYAGEAWATRCGILALLYPPLLANAFNEFHELAFYPVLALAMIWAADRARWLWFAIFSLALIAISENACVDLVVIGIALGLVGLVKSRNSAQTGLLRGQPIEPARLAIGGGALALFSAGALAFYALVIVPRTGPWPEMHFYRYAFANGPVQVAFAVFLHPLQLAPAVLTLGRFTYLLEALVPLAFLALRSRWALLSLPAFASILLANDSSIWRMGNHYALLFAPWLLLAAASALMRLSLRHDDRAALRWWWSAISVCVLMLIFFNPMHPAHYLVREPYQHDIDIARAFACVPYDAPVATHDEWYAHVALAYRRSTIIRSDQPLFNGYLVFDTKWGNALFQHVELPQIEAARAQGRYAVACSSGTVLALRPLFATAK